MQVISFAEYWKTQKTSIQESINNGKQIWVNCKYCKGTGGLYHDWENEREVLCPKCKGEGGYHALSADHVEVSRDKYIAEVTSELRLLAGWNPHRFDFFNLCCEFFSQQAQDQTQCSSKT